MSNLRSASACTGTVQSYILEEDNHDIYMARIEVVTREGADALAREVADYVARRAAQAVSARGRFVVALSGGSMPKVRPARWLARASARTRGCC